MADDGLPPGMKPVDQGDELLAGMVPVQQGLTPTGTNPAGFPTFQGTPDQHPVLSGIDRMLAPSDMTGNDPNTLKGYLKTWGETLKGAGAGIKSLITTPLPGTDANPINWNPVTQFKKDAAGLGNWYQQFKENPNYAAGEMAGPALLTHTVAKLLTPAGMVAKLTRGTGGMAEDIEPTINDLRSITKDPDPVTGKPFGNPNTVGDFIKQAGAAEDKLNKEYANTLGPHANDPGPITPNGTFPVSDAILKLKDKLGNTTSQDVAARAYIDKVASEFQNPLTLDELNRQRIAANNRLFSFEKKSDVAQYSAAGSNAGTAVDRAIANTVRDVVYPRMDQLAGKPDGYFRDLQNRVGNLFRLQSDAQDFAKSVHQKTMLARGSTPMERVKPGVAGSGGGVHGYISNIPAMFRAPNPEGAANSAVESAYGIGQRFSPPPPELSLPVASLMAMIRSNKGTLKDVAPNHPLNQTNAPQQ